jgi:hypothetical protein
MKALLIASVLLTSIAGCGATLNKMGGVGQIESNIDRLTGSQKISVTATPTHNFEGEVATSKFGASWDSTSPGKVFLRLTSSSSVSQSDTYVSFESMEVSINGEIRKIDFGRTSQNSGGYNSLTRDIYTESRASKYLDYDYFNAMVNSPTTKIRVHTIDWFEDIDFQKETNGIGADLAKSSLLKFIEEIDKNR